MACAVSVPCVHHIDSGLETLRLAAHQDPTDSPWALDAIQTC